MPEKAINAKVITDDTCTKVIHVQGSLSSYIMDDYNLSGHKPLTENIEPVALPKDHSFTRSKLVSLMKEKDRIVKTMTDKKTGEVYQVFDQKMNINVTYLTSLKKALYFYEMQLKNNPDSKVWLNHRANKIFSNFSCTKSLAQLTTDFIDLAKSLMSKADKQKLEKSSVYGGPLVGEYRANRDPNPNEPYQGFPGILLECTEGFYSGPVEDNMPADGSIGKMEYHDGAVYIGLFKNGMPDGEGILTLPDKTVLKGRFEEGEFKERKALSDAFLSQIGEPIVKKSEKPISIIDQYLPSIETRHGKYIGPVNENNEPHGKGQLISNNGTYNVTFQNGILTDWPNKKTVEDLNTPWGKYSGPVLDDKPQGQGFIKDMGYTVRCVFDGGQYISEEAAK